MKQKALPHPYTPQALKALSSRLERVAGRLASIRSQMEEEGAGEIYVFNHPTMTAGIRHVESFCMEAEKSWDAYAAGDPYTENTRKSRGKVMEVEPDTASNGEKKPRKKRAPKKSASASGAGEKGEG